MTSKFFEECWSMLKSDLDEQKFSETQLLYIKEYVFFFFNLSCRMVGQQFKDALYDFDPDVAQRFDKYAQKIIAKAKKVEIKNEN